MDAEEIVQALRICNRTKGHRCSECPVFSRYAHGICKRTVDRTAANLIESLQAQLAESRRRERAAVEDFEGCMKNKKERCAYCMHDDECEPGESLCYANVCGFEWRGQQAGKGDAPNE